MNYTQKKILAIVSALLMILIAVGIILSAYAVPKWTGTDTINVHNTIEYEAEVESVEKIKDGFIIYLSEYECQLKVESKMLDQGYDLLSIVNKGGRVIFRKLGPQIDLSKIINMKLDILSLKYEDIDIIPLSISNEIRIETIKRGKIFTAIVGGFLIISAIILCTCVLIKTKSTKNINHN